MNFGYNLKNAIKSRGFDIDEVAIQIDVEASTLYGYSENLYYPQFNNLCEICNRFLIAPNELFVGMYNSKTDEAINTIKIACLLDTLSPGQKQTADKVIDAFINHLGRKDLNSLGGRIRRLRNYYDLSAETLAKKAHLAPSTVRNIEANTSQPSVNSMLTLANVFQVSPDYLLYERVNVHSEKRYLKLLPNEIALLYDVLCTFFKKEKL